MTLFKRLKKLFKKQPINVIGDLVLPMPDDPEWKQSYSTFLEGDWSYTDFYRIELGPVVVAVDTKAIDRKNRGQGYNTPFLFIDKVQITEHPNEVEKYCFEVFGVWDKKRQEKRLEQEIIEQQKQQEKQTKENELKIQALERAKRKLDNFMFDM